MKIKAVSGIMLTLMLVSTLTLVFNIQPVRASGTVYIRADGSVDPPTANIASVDNVTYTFTGNIYEAIIVERDNIVVDGAKYILQGPLRYGGIGICLTGRSNVTVKNVKIIGFSDPIWLHWSSNNTISGNKIMYSWGGGITIYKSSGNVISGNIIINDGVKGMAITISGSSKNIIWENKITNNYEGLSLHGGKNIISGNSITNNKRGICLGFSNNSIYHNNFVNNTDQVYGYAPTNVWDDGYPSGGNYWSDYEERYPDAQELDGSGIWDTPYVSDENNQDNFPLVNPWTPSQPAPEIPQEALEDLIEAIKIWNLPGGTEKSLASKLEEAIHLLNIGNENGATHKLTQFIDIVEALGKKLTIPQKEYLILEAQRIISLING